MKHIVSSFRAFPGFHEYGLCSAVAGDIIIISERTGIQTGDAPAGEQVYFPCFRNRRCAAQRFLVIRMVSAVPLPDSRLRMPAVNDSARSISSNSRNCFSVIILICFSSFILLLLPVPGSSPVRAGYASGEQEDRKRPLICPDKRP